MLEVRNLTCGYEGKAVLHDVSLDVPKGEFLGIIGPNGSGKTTLFRAVMRMLPVMSGSVSVEGDDVRKLSPAELTRRLAVVPQISDMPFAFTVRELVAFGRFPHLKRFQRFSRRDTEAVALAMSQVEVERLADRSASHLSSGEKQRVFIAQALAQEPRLLLLDEPISHLDIRHQVDILDLCRRLNRNGLTVVVILHDLNLAAEYCDRIALFSDGRVKACGPPGEILDYRLIEEVYKTVVIVRENPLSKKPFILLVSESALKKNSKTEENKK